MPLPSLIKKADRVFSKWVRVRDKNICCTCGKVGKHAGHFVRRRHLKVRWHPYNVASQCVFCNTFLDGNEAEYSRFIINKYGMEIFNWLLDQKGVYKVTREEVEKVIQAYS